MTLIKKMRRWNSDIFVCSARPRNDISIEKNELAITLKGKISQDIKTRLRRLNLLEVQFHVFLELLVLHGEVHEVGEGHVALAIGRVRHNWLSNPAVF